MLVRHEREVRGRLALLEEAWVNSASFALLPDKVSVTTEWLQRSFDVLPAELRQGCFILLTSGTTGQPKLVVGQKDRAVALVRELHERQDSHELQETISVLPLAYSYSFVNQWVWARVHQRRFVLSEGFGDPQSAIGALSRAQQAMICMVGVQVPLLMASCQGMVFPGVTRVHFAGGRFPQEKLADLARVFPNARVFNNYGCAEAMPRLTVRESTQAPEGANVGRPLCGVEIAAGDDHAVMFRSPFGAVGVVEDQVFRAIPREEWIPSGDLGCIEADGSLRLIGRNSEVFKRHGEKVSMAVLASTVAAPWHGQVALYREADPTGEDGCVLVLAPIASTDQIRPVLMSLRKYHPRSHWPIRIETMPELPLLPNGKADLRRIAAASDKREIWKQHI